MKRGFTFIEWLVALVVVALIAGIILEVFRQRGKTAAEMVSSPFTVEAQDVIKGRWIAVIRIKATGERLACSDSGVAVLTHAEPTNTDLITRHVVLYRGYEQALCEILATNSYGPKP